MIKNLNFDLLILSFEKKKEILIQQLSIYYIHNKLAKPKATLRNSAAETIKS